MTDPALLFPSLPAPSGKKVSTAFDGGRITSDGGMMMLAEAKRRLGIADRLAALIPDRRNSSRTLRHYPAFKMALGRTPDAITLDIDDTFDAAHGEQHLTCWNGFHGEHGFSPIHVYEAESECPVAFVLRPAKTPSGAEARAHVRRLVRHIRQHWLDVHILLRGDGHYAWPELMAYCEAAGVDYLFGLPMNAVLRRDPVIAAVAVICAVVRAKCDLPVHRTHAETTYAANS